MKARFYCPLAGAPISGGSSGDIVKLADAEAHHLLHVLRAQPGDEVTLFNGRGWEFLAPRLSSSRREVELEILERCEVDREASLSVTVAVAIPKGDRQRFLVEKCVELGVRRLVPLQTERSVAQPQAAALGRLRRAVIEASKQCGRNRLLEIAEPRPLLSHLGSETEGTRWLCHPGAASGPRDLKGGINPMSFAVGPEGGFAAAEVAAARELGWQVLDLGPRILRIETAVLFVASLGLVLG